MLKRIVRCVLKAAVAIVSFALIFCLIQPFFIPKFISNEAESTVLVNSFRALPENSVDVLFLGSSQMFRTVDSERLYNKYHINAWNYGASGQLMSITPYYLYEALKTQSPKLIVVEVGCIFYKNSDLTQKEIAWNYAPTRLTKEKIASLKEVLGSTPKAYMQAFFPLLVYHDRWRTLNDPVNGGSQYDLEYVFHPERYNGLYPRGFVGLDIVNQQELNYDKSDDAIREIPEESRTAVGAIAKECRERNIRLLFFKSPAPVWTRGECETVSRFMAEMELDYIDLNECYEEMAVNGATDFSDSKHLNADGARKVTDYLAKLLPAYME